MLTKLMTAAVAAMAISSIFLNGICMTVGCFKLILYAISAAAPGFFLAFAARRKDIAIFAMAAYLSAIYAVAVALRLWNIP
jgi:hypothetical protein